MAHQNKTDESQTDRDGNRHTPTRTEETHLRDDVLYLDQRNGDVAPGGSGAGTRLVSVLHRYWWRTHDLTAWINGWDNGGDPYAPAHVIENSLGWNQPSQYTPPSLPAALWEDLAASPEGQWIGAHWGDVLRVAGGAVDLGLGVGLSLGSGGLAILPGVGLMAVGIDQVYAGAAAIATGQRNPSVIEFVGATAAGAAGAGPAAAQTIGALTPAALSILFTFGGSLLTSTEGTLGAAADEIGTSPRPLPPDVESRIIKLYPGDALPPELHELPRFAATSLRTGEIFVNGALWDTLADATKARLFFEELSHQGRILATPRFLRPVRGLFLGMSDTYRFVEEMRAGWDATESFTAGFSYAWNYPDISRLQIAGELGAGAGGSAYITWQILYDR